jgi:hypothetical protein
VRNAISRREEDRDRELRRLQNEAAKRRQNMNGAAKTVHIETEKDPTNDITQNSCGQ